MQPSLQVPEMVNN